MIKGIATDLENEGLEEDSEESSLSEDESESSDEDNDPPSDDELGNRIIQSLARLSKADFMDLYRRATQHRSQATTPTSTQTVTPQVVRQTAARTSKFRRSK